MSKVTPYFKSVKLQGMFMSITLTKHPQNRGPSRKWAVEFTKALGKALVEWGALTPEQLEEAEKLEAEEGSSELRESV
jgi:hypothetical protein